VYWQGNLETPPGSVIGEGSAQEDSAVRQVVAGGLVVSVIHIVRTMLGHAVYDFTAQT